MIGENYVGVYFAFLYVVGTVTQHTNKKLRSHGMKIKFLAMEYTRDRTSGRR